VCARAFNNITRDKYLYKINIFKYIKFIFENETSK
jgi:hypothetical protein